MRMALLGEKDNLTSVVQNYLHEIREILGNDYIKGVVYGSFARGEYSEESDIDIAIFTNRNPEDLYVLRSEIADITFEYDMKYDIILSPVFHNVALFNRMLGVMPYYQSIQKEGICFD